MLKEIENYICKLTIILKITHGAFLLALVFFLIAIIQGADYSIIESFKTLEITSAMAVITALYYERTGLVFANVTIMVFVFLQIIAV